MPTWAELQTRYAEALAASNTPVTSHANLLLEPGFERGGSLWVRSRKAFLVEGTEPRSGLWCLRLTPAVGQDRLQFTRHKIPCTPNQTCYGEFWAKSSAPGAHVVAGMDWYTPGDVFHSRDTFFDFMSPTTTYTKYSGNMTAPDVEVTHGIMFFGTLGSSTANNIYTFFDDLAVVHVHRFNDSTIATQLFLSRYQENV